MTDDPATWDNPDIIYDPADPYLQRTKSGAQRRIWAGDIYAGWLGYGFDDHWDGLLNLTWRTGETGRVTFSGMTNNHLSAPYTDAWRWSMLWGLPAEVQHNVVWGTPRYDAESPDQIIPNTGLTDWHNEKNVLFEESRRVAVIWTHQPDPETYYSLRASYYGLEKRLRVWRFVNADGYAERFEHYYDPYGGDPVWRPGDPMNRVTLRPFPYGTVDYFSRAYGYTAIGGAGLGQAG